MEKIIVINGDSQIDYLTKCRLVSEYFNTFKTRGEGRHEAVISCDSVQYIVTHIPVDSTFVFDIRVSEYYSSKSGKESYDIISKNNNEIEKERDKAQEIIDLIVGMNLADALFTLDRVKTYIQTKSIIVK